ncbi:hypothetical protein AQF52_7853 [Streptomyces venezuelae]|nr:hypothetical protein AQF52_7853 [Streptomyces venezuelae]CUM35842.1 putative integral membrane protein [Streptomyces venezuelae]
MAFLSAAQRRAGRELGSASWADPIAALVIAAIAVKEGRDAWQGKGCCAVPAAAAAPAKQQETDACGCRPGCDCCT